MTTVAAKDLDRDSIGIDTSLDYCDLMRERLSKSTRPAQTDSNANA